MRGYYPLFSLSTVFHSCATLYPPCYLRGHWQFLIHQRSSFLSFFSFLLILSPPFPSPLYYCQAVKWMLAYFRALLSNSLSCAGQVCGSAECNLAADETSTLKQLARPPTVARWTERSGSVQESNGEYYLYPKVSHPPCQRISDLLMRDVYTADTPTPPKKRRRRRSRGRAVLKGQSWDAATSPSQAQQRLKMGSVKRSGF